MQTLIDAAKTEHDVEFPSFTEAKAVLQGAPEVHVQTGESLRLHCTVQHATSPPQFIFWYHNGSMINYAPPRPLKVVRHHYNSDLHISDVRWEDAGAYRCEPEKAHPANLTLHVVAGKCVCLRGCGVCSCGGEKQWWWRRWS